MQFTLEGWQKTHKKRRTEGDSEGVDAEDVDIGVAEAAASASDGRNAQLTQQKGKGKQRSDGERGGKGGRNQEQPHQGAILHRLDAIEKMLMQHDRAIRDQDASNMCVYLLPAKASSTLYDKLFAQQQLWTTSRPRKGPHPLGPPRRGLAVALCETMAAEWEVSKPNAPLLTVLKSVRDPSELDQAHFQLFSVTYTKAKDRLLRVRFYAQVAHLWLEATEWLAETTAEAGGQRRPDRAPPGPLFREMAQRHQRKE